MTPQPTNIDWPGLVFLAEAEREPFANIQIVTLYSHCEDLAYQQLLTPLAKSANLDNALNLAEANLATVLPTINAKEFLAIFEDRVVIAIDVDIIDDDAIEYALDLLSTVESFEVGTFIEFGTDRTYDVLEVDEQPQLM